MTNNQMIEAAASNPAIGILIKNGQVVYYAFCGKARIYTQCSTIEAMEYWLGRED